MKRFLLSALVLLGACSGGSDGTGTPVTPPTPSIALTLSSAAGTATRGGTANTTITLTRGGGYGGAVTLGTGTLPAGVTVTFSSPTLSGGTSTSTATITVGAAAATGTAPITFTASGSGVTTASATYTLTVPTPSITVSSGAPTLSVVQGASGAVPITITRVNGYADPITLTATGLPGGVTATFTPATLSGSTTTSTLTLSAATVVAPGTSTVTVTASGTGVTSQTTTFALTITAAATPSIALTATPAALAVTAGQQATSALAVTRSGGFAGEVTLAVSGAPAGMTATVAPATVPSSATTATLTVATTGAVAPGTYSLTVTATGTGVTATSTTVAVTVSAAPGIQLASTAATTSGAAGATATVGVTLTRLGSYAGDVTLAVQGLPSGISAAFAPAILTGSTLTSTLTLTIGASVAPGTYALSLNAAGPGSVSAQTPLSLTVTAAQGYTLAATATSLAQGGTGTSTATITRTGGFAGTVNLAVSGLPTGVTAVVNPAAVTGTTATITFTATAGATTGAFTATLTGTATGLANVTTTIAGTVTSSGGGGGTGNIVFRFCDPAELPLFVAYRNGRTGNWVRATNDGTNRYRFQIDDLGGVTVVKPLAGGTSDVYVWYGSAAQLTLIGQQECVSNPPTKTLTGTFAGLSPAQSGSVGMGGGFALGTPGANAFTISNVALGSTDLLAFRSAQGFGGGGVTVAPDRGILRRGVDYPAGSAIPVLDFNASEAFAPATAAITVNNGGSGLLTVFAGFFTGTSTFNAFTFGSLFGGSNPYTVYGVPSSLTRAGDYHLVQATSNVLQNNVLVESRTATQFNQNLANRTLTLGPTLFQPTYTTLSTSPYARVRASAAWQTEYGDQLQMGLQQGSGGATRNWAVVMTRAYSAGSATYELEVPDLTATAGWDNNWGLRSGTSTTASLTAFSAGAPTFVEGLTVLTGLRLNTITP